MVSNTKPILFYRPSAINKYPVFMFQLGANSFGSNIINRHTYDIFLKHLASYGFVIIVIDVSQAGYPNGTSFKEIHTWYNEKCTDVNHWLYQYADTNKFVIGGHSNGGVNASALLVERPSEINGIVFWDSYPNPGVLGIGAHDVSNYPENVLIMTADENTPETYKSGFEKFTNSSCKSFINIEGLDHGGFGDYVLASQPVGSIGRENATATIRHFFVSWFLSRYKYDSNANQKFSNAIYQPNTTKEFINNCNILEINQNQIEDFKIFPNPAHDFIKIKSENIIDIEIFNSIGQSIIKQNKLYNTSIDISYLKKGLYIISISDNKSKTIKKIIIE